MDSSKKRSAYLICRAGWFGSRLFLDHFGGADGVFAEQEVDERHRDTQGETDGVRAVAD